MSKKMINYKKPLLFGVACPVCGKRHRSEYGIMDYVITCDCGHRFYTFGDCEFWMGMPPGYLKNEEIFRNMCRLIYSTGRGQYIRPGILLESDKDQYWPVRDTIGDLDLALNEFQTAMVGKNFLVSADIFAICELLKDGKDVHVRSVKDGVSVVELRRKDIPEEEREKLMYQRLESFRKKIDIRS